MAAAELWHLAKSTGRTPWEALMDPHLNFNLSVMRGYDKAKQVAEDMATASIERTTEGSR